MKIRLNPGFASFFGALFIRLLGSTLRIEWRGAEHVDEARKISGQVIFAFWHGRLLVFSWTHRKQNIQVLASEHYDGDLMGRSIERLGFGHIKGSTTRGGARALMTLTSLLKKGLDVGLTVDGPKGPLGHVQQGAVELGRLGSSAVIPMSCSAKRRVLLGSWDRFQIPLPFTRVVIEYERPITVPSDTGADEREKIRLGLEEKLGQMTRTLDLEMGYKGKEAWPHEDN
ncbi:MAG: lysophospholipid acyltransferase family protein [Candidatus Krumholzibacteriota bacterium]|nr:lysophospholipid acyltransferase family protein [Candidatus Krumholzibacteriota bacterium]